MKNTLTLLCMFTFLLLCNISANASEALPKSDTKASCQSENILVEYEIANERLGQTTTLILVRSDNKVAHQYPDTRVTEAWELNKAGGIKPTRFFDAHERAIEYQPAEKIHGKIETDWTYRYQLVSDHLFEQASLIGNSGKGCDRIQSYVYENDNLHYQLEYLPGLSVIKSFQVRTLDGSIIEHWNKKSLRHDKQAVDQFFKQRDRYKATDFADIGDDHTDPFLTQMVSVGFIEAGASGFYHADSKGNVSSFGVHQH